MLERLETRRLMAFTASINNGTLDVRSGVGGSEVHVIEDQGFVHVFGESFAEEMFFSGVTRINLWGNTGNDTLFFHGNTVGATVRGNSGSDYITIVDEGSGASDANGESDNDVLVLVVGNTSGSATTLDGGSGDDHIQINTGYVVDPLQYNFAAARAYVIAGSGDDIISTYAGNTTVNGGSGADSCVEFAGTGTNVYIKVENVTAV